MLPPYERLGQFYLGRRYDLSAGARQADLVLYDSKDLVTHAVCVGMTGSGKTGLGIILIEEAALDGVPVLAIDPKGDLSNLLLTFPALTAEAFLPWVDAGDARTRQQSPDAVAADVAAAWKAGLAEWDQDEARIQRLRSAAGVRVYTPGSRAGVPLSLLKTLGAGADEGPDERAARAATVAASLLSLAGIGDAAPHSREQALLSAILAHDSAPPAADLPWLVQQIQRPALDRVGVLDLETFFPSRDRQELALRFNSVLAAPGFDTWSAGDPLDPGRMLYTPEGRPRIAIVSVAHLDDTQRMMAVSLVLHAVVEWSRRQGGTSSLRLVVYMDEVFGFLPPVANPPSKLPLLTLLKQARAAGIGMVLATQNPVDLDYKALSNSGTWFLGRLQTERDKARLLDGLQSVSSGLGSRELDRTLAALRKRVFLMHNIHEDEPVVFETRWTLSYLRGPLTRDELRRAAGPAAEAPGPATDAPGRKPILPAGIEEYFLPTDGEARAYAPVLYGSARVYYDDPRRGVDVTADIHVVTPLTDAAVAADWSHSIDVDTGPEALERAPATPGATYQTLPASALNPGKYAGWARDFENWIVRERPFRLFAAPAFRLHAGAAETEAEFMARVHQAAREARDAQVEQLRARYSARVARAADRIQRATDAVAREEQQAQQQKLQTAVSFGATLLGALMGRKAASLSTLGRATTAARGAGRTAKEMNDIARSQERLRDAEDALAALEAELQREIAALPAAPDAAHIETVAIKPKRGSIDVRLVALAWKG